jgi:hypothetical protein
MAWESAESAEKWDTVHGMVERRNEKAREGCQRRPESQALWAKDLPHKIDREPTTTHVTETRAKLRYSASAKSAIVLAGTPEKLTATRNRAADFSSPLLPLRPSSSRYTHRNHPLLPGAFLALVFRRSANATSYSVPLATFVIPILVDPWRTTVRLCSNHFSSLFSPLPWSGPPFAPSADN